MFIPAQTPDLQQPLTQLLETKPVLPVTAVPGIPEDAQNLDSRVALQWTQPVLQGEKGQATRNALAVPLAVQIVKPLNIKGFEPQGPDPDALRKGEVHPMLAEGLASWINSVVSKPVPNFRANPAPLQTEVTEEIFEPSELATVMKQASQKTESPVMQVLLNLYAALANSDVFAAQRLAESWLPRRAKPTHLEVDNSDRPTSEPSIAQLTKWVSALEPDSEPAQQAAHMLTQGQMVWLADLAPGVPMRIVREDAWRNDLDRRAQLEKGAMLRVELNLPNLGRIRVVGSQWGQDLSLQIAHDASSQDQWTMLAPSLLNDLQAQGIGEVRFETLSEVEEQPNGQRTA
jgi:hypothetical protein